MVPPIAPVKSEKNDSKRGDSWPPPCSNSDGPKSTFDVYCCSEHNLSVASLHWIAYMLNKRSFAQSWHRTLVTPSKRYPGGYSIGSRGDYNGRRVLNRYLQTGRGEIRTLRNVNRIATSSDTGTGALLSGTRSQWKTTKRQVGHQMRLMKSPVNMMIRVRRWKVLALYYFKK
jgi:hypothetical protein